MPQIGVHTLDRKRVALVVNISDVFAEIIHVTIPDITVCGVFLRRRRGVNYGLDPCRGFIPRNVKTYDLPGFTAHHRHHIHVFAGFGFAFPLQKPVQFI
jgi:hypothetical protein